MIAPLVAAVLFQSQNALSSAGVKDFSIYESEYYDQNSDTQPAILTYVAFFAGLHTLGKDQATSLTLTTPKDQLPVDAAGHTWFYLYDVMKEPDLSILENKYPPGAYTFKLSGGDLNGKSATLNKPAPEFPEEIPYLSVKTYSSLQGISPSKSLNLTWEPWTPSGKTANGHYTFFNIYDLDNGEKTAFTFGGKSDSHGVQLPAGTLRPHGHYKFRIVFGNRIESRNTPFTGAYSTVTFDRYTTGKFETSDLQP